MPIPRLVLVPVLVAGLMVGCNTTSHPDASGHRATPAAAQSNGGSARVVETMTVPEGIRGVILLPEDINPWLFTQRERSIVYLMGTGSLHIQGPLAVAGQPPEFHVGNRFFFAEGLGVDAGEADTLVARLADEHGEPPFVMTAPHQVVVPGRTVIIPSNFDGRLIWIRPTGRNTAYTRRFTTEILRIRGTGSQ